MEKEDKAGKYLRGLLFDNLGYKVIAIVCSLIFFYSFQTERMGTRTITTDIIAIMETPTDDYILVSEFPPQVAMKLEGPMSTLKSLKGEDIGPLVISVSDFQSKVFTFDESIIEALPKAVNVVRFYPDSIPLRYERRVEKNVPIVPSIEGVPPAGRLLRTPVEVVPGKVRIKGAESSMKKITEWETQAIYVDALAPGTHEIKVNLSPPKLSHITLEEEKATAIVKIEYKLMDRWFRDVPLSIEGKEDFRDLKIKPSKVSVLLRGPEEFLKPLAVDQLNLYVTIFEEEILTGGTFQKDINYGTLPEQTSPIKQLPSKVTVVLKPPGN